MANYTQTQRHAVISISSSGDNTVIAAPGAGKRIYIDQINLLPNSAVVLTLKNGSTALSGAYSFASQQGFTADNSYQNEHGILECSDNTAFVINLGTSVQVSGFVKYRINNE